tara:strand:+ start:590 stop:844 length:255 start_codon:yes stop_codon:yes gene_type:complete
VRNDQRGHLNRERLLAQELAQHPAIVLQQLLHAEVVFILVGLQNVERSVAGAAVEEILCRERGGEKERERERAERKKGKKREES